MVQWERQLEERSLPAWRDKMVAYGRLKRKLDQLKMHTMVPEKNFMARALSEDSGGDASGTGQSLVESALTEQMISEYETKREEFLSEVHSELRRVSAWYQDTVTNLEAQVRELTGQIQDSSPGLIALPAGKAEDIGKLHLEAARLTEYVLLNVEALRKIVKKMDKQCKTNYQPTFVEQHLKKSPLASANSAKGSFNGERARRCRRELEQLLSPERLQELRSQAMAPGVGAGLSQMPLKPRKVAMSVLIAAAAWPCAATVIKAEKAQRCVMLLFFTVSMWVLEAAPFEATALLVPPIAVILSVLEGDKLEQGKQILNQVFSSSLYLVIAGFAITSVFSSCQLDSRAAEVLQRRFGKKPLVFLLAVMFLGLGLSALLSNVTAPMLLIEVLKPLVRDMPTDSRYSRALLLGLAFACNVGGMMTPISSPQNVASLAILKQRGGNISWGEWLMVTVPFCTVGVVVAWLLLLVFYRYDLSEEEKRRETKVLEIPPIVFEKEELTARNWASLACATGTMAVFACAPVAEFFGGSTMVALLFVALALATGMISRQTFNSYNWAILFLIGGGSALGFAVNESGLLKAMTHFAKKGLSDSPWMLIAELVALLVGVTNFVSHTVAALVLMPLVAELGATAGIPNLAVLVGAIACSAACALPMTSFPNVNSLMAVDDTGKPWLSARHFLLAGTPLTISMALLIVTLGFSLASVALA